MHHVSAPFFMAKSLIKKAPFVKKQKALIDLAVAQNTL